MILRVRFLNSGEHHIKVTTAAVVPDGNTNILKYTPVGEAPTEERNNLPRLCEYARSINIENNDIFSVDIIDGRYKESIYSRQRNMEFSTFPNT